MTVAFYISGHGFGHASRQVEIINAFGARHPETGILVRSAAARWLFERTIRVPFELDARPCDTGVVQIDSLRPDVAKTFAEARVFYGTFDARTDEEARLLQERGVRLVIVDAAPLGCAAAARAGIPSVVVSNFTWDWIYADYAEHEQLAPGLTAMIGNAYRTARAAWRLPMHGGFETFDAAWLAEAPQARRRLDVPFVARHAAHGREETRRRLGLPLDRLLVLPTFSAYGVDGLEFSKLDTDHRWQVLGDFPDNAVYEAGLRREDLVAAVDVIVTKPGYGIISECLANGTAMVYTPRGQFIEYDVLVRDIPRYLRSAFLDNASLMAGRWQDALDRAVTAPPPPERPRTDGAEVIAEMMGNW